MTFNSNLFFYQIFQNTLKQPGFEKSKNKIFLYYNPLTKKKKTAYIEAMIITNDLREQ